MMKQNFISGMRNNTRKVQDYTADPSKYPQGYFRLKECKTCGDYFQPIAPSQLYCGQECKDLGHANKYYQSVYGISVHDFVEMLQDQDEKCAICGGEGFKMHEGIKESLVVDHNHDTGRVRGLLCNNCNRGLGLFQDSIKNLQSAIRYLKNDL